MRSYRGVIFLWVLNAVQAGYAADESPAQQQQDPEIPAEQQNAPAPGKHRFNIWEFRVEGNTLLDDRLVERTVYPFLGTGKSIQDVEAAQQALEAFYRDSGFPTVVVDIPEQNVSEGIVHLKVVQGTVSRVRITGSRYFSLGRIRSRMTALSEGDVVYLPELQRQLRDINRASPDRTVTPVFRPGHTPGTVEVELRVKDELPIHGDIELNNRYSRDTTKLRASATLRYANLWQREHSASVMYQTAPEDRDEVEVWAGTYVMPAGSGSVLATYVVDSKSDVATAGDLTVLGTGTILGVRYIKSLPDRDRYFHSAVLGVDYKDFKDDVVPVDGGSSDTPIDYTNFLAQYRGTLLGSKARTGFGLSVDFGVRGLGNTEKEFENKRYGAKPNYLYVGAFGEFTYTFDPGIQFYLGLDGQLADSPLVSNEQFRAGGAESVRGYLESQDLGDDGITANLELRTPSFADKVPYVSKMHFLAFFDASKLRIRQPLPSQKSHYELYSTGIGVRIEGDHGLSASLDWAWPLKDVTDVEKGDSRAHFSLQYGF